MSSLLSAARALSEPCGSFRLWRWKATLSSAALKDGAWASSSLACCNVSGCEVASSWAACRTFRLGSNNRLRTSAQRKQQHKQHGSRRRGRDKVKPETGERARRRATGRGSAASGLNCRRCLSNCSSSRIGTGFLPGAQGFAKLGERVSIARGGGVGAYPEHVTDLGEGKLAPDVQHRDLPLLLA